MEAKIKDYKDYQGPTSREWTVDIDLEAKDSFQKRMYFDFLSSKNIAVSIKLIGATGTSGTITGGWASRKRGKIFPLPTPLSILLIANDEAAQIVPELSGRLLALDLSGVTFGTVGKVQIIITGKAH